MVEKQSKEDQIIKTNKIIWKNFFKIFVVFTKGVKLVAKLGSDIISELKNALGEIQETTSIPNSIIEPVKMENGEWKLENNKVIIVDSQKDNKVKGFKTKELALKVKGQILSKKIDPMKKYHVHKK